MQTDVTSERAARNQATFRSANEEIERSAEELEVDAGRIPFICECPDPACTSIALLSLVSYEMVRSRGEWFLVVPGHETCTVDGTEIARTHKRYDTFSLMQKIGDAGDVARRLDER